jgi:hypothetical protein
MLCNPTAKTPSASAMIAARRGFLGAQFPAAFEIFTAIFLVFITMPTLCDL